MELVVVVVVSVVAILSVVAATRGSLSSVNRGWEAANEAYRTTLELQTARITTLENRQAAPTWEIFANLQTVPDELAKASYSEQSRRPQEAWGETLEERIQSQAAADGTDLEGVNLTGPTIG